MTAITIITTEQAPSSKPVSISKVLTTEWQTFVDVPMYDIPLVGFGSSRRIAPGVAEPSAPVLFTNVSSGSSEAIDVRIKKAYRPLAQNVTQATINGAWTPGSDYQVGTIIYLTTTPVERDADPFFDPYAAIQIDAVDGAGAVTEFSVLSGAIGETVTIDGIQRTIIRDQGVFPGQLMYQLAVQYSSQHPLVIAGDKNEGDSAPGIGFTITPDRDDLDDTIGVITLAHQLKVEPNDILLLPLNGQFFLSAELVEMRCTTSDSNVHATISFTLGQSEEDQIYF